MKTAYITGADRGLGSALTQVLLEMNYKVYAGQYMPKWIELQTLKEKYSQLLNIIPLNVSSLESVTKASDIIKTNEKSLDLLINNAAIHDFIEKKTIFYPFTQPDYEIMHNLYDVNALGPLRVTQSVIDLVVKSENKTIVNISSEAGSIADNWRDDDFGYCMSKTALNMQSAILQHSVKEFGVKVLCFHPGWLRSYMSGKLNEDATEEPLDVAYKIVEVLSSKKHMNIDSPMFLNYQGSELRY
jgi:NAD(P)-dependent dehydrogenase (short-subunit alcohol dehydrogenase family)